MKAVIAYYSKTGTTEKAAEAIGRELRAAGVETTFEIIKPLRSKGYIRNMLTALFRQEVPILNVNLDLGEYDYIIIGGPVWALSMAPPINSYLRDIKGVSGKRAAAFVTVGAFGGEIALGQISHGITELGGRYKTGLKVSDREMPDEKALDERIKVFLKMLME